MSRWIYLSYPIDENTPAYGGGKSFCHQREKQISLGDTCNTSRWEMPNHIGTHIDLPAHFSRNGKTMEDYPADFWIFREIAIIDISPVRASHIISWEDLASQISGHDDNTELLLVKTGFCDLRSDSAYRMENPGFHPELADHLRKNFLKLRVLGFDSISLSSFTHRELGRQAHKAFLENMNPILLLEDTDLSMINRSIGFERIVVSPFRVCGADAAPCTVLAEVS